MKKRLLLGIVFALLLGMGVYGVSRNAPIAQAQSHRPVVIMHSSGLSAQAFFNSVLENGDNLGVGVFPNIGSQQIPPGKPIKGSSVDVVVLEFDPSGSNLLVLASGQMDVPGLHIDGTKLTGATLPLTTVTMEVTDPNTGNPTGQTFSLQIAVSWTGTGAVSSDHGTFHFREPGFIETTHTSGKFRNATAGATTLTFTLPDGTNVNMSGATDEFANLGNFRSLDIVITH